MLSETFLSSISHPNPNTKALSSTTPALRDAGIFLHQYQPHPSLSQSFKKSATNPHGVAISSTHVYAAQSDKAVVHVYNRDKGNQECVVPFPEKIRCLSLCCDDLVLAMGMEGGRVVLWEVATGRLIPSAAAHLGPVSVLGTASEDGCWLLSGSVDSNIHVWSLPSLLSFSPPTSTDLAMGQVRAPVRTLAGHRGAITALVLGHSKSSANIAISAGKDGKVCVWNHDSGALLRTYLLHSTPLCLALDPADRASYAGCDDGSIQKIDFYVSEKMSSALLSNGTTEAQEQISSTAPIQHPLHDPYSSSAVQLHASAAITAPALSLGSTLSVTLSYDGTTILTGHESGKIVSWDIARGAYVSNVSEFAGPVTNLGMLRPEGFPANVRAEMELRVLNVVKPGYSVDMSTSADEGGVPGNYALNVQLVGAKRARKTVFEEAFEYPGFPPSLLQSGIDELSTHRSQTLSPAPTSEHNEDFMSLDSATDAGLAEADPQQQLRDEVQSLQEQVLHVQRLQRISFAQLTQLTDEKRAWLKGEEDRRKRRIERQRARARREERAWDRLTRGEDGRSAGVEDEGAVEDESLDSESDNGGGEESGGDN